jgi:ABC-2 type transport system ATP-binding protein
MPEVERLADRVGLLTDGQLVATGTPAQLVTDHGGDARLIVQTAARPDRATLDAVAAAAPGFDVAAHGAGDVGRADGNGESGDAADSAGRDGLVVRGLAAADIGEAIAALDEAGVAYEALAWRQPGLEDVYLRLTGNAFEGATGLGYGAASSLPTGGTSAAEDADPGNAAVREAGDAGQEAEQ